MTFLPGQSLFSAPKPADVIEPPATPDPIEVPDPEDIAKKNAKRRLYAQDRQRSGRASTLNTAPTSVALG